MHCPTLWGRVLMRQKYFSALRLAAHLALSQRCPLDIRFVSELAEIRWFTFKEIITPHAWRLRSLAVRFEMVSDLADFFQLWASWWSTPNLKSLTINLHDIAPRAWQMESELPPPFSWSNISVESLTTLKLSGYYIENFPAAPNIKFLRLNEINEGLATFKYLQDNYPLLETLVIDGMVSRGNDDTSTVVEMTSLRALAFWPSSEFVDNVLDSISIPNLCRLHITVCSGDVPLLRYFRAMKNLRELYIAFPWHTKGELTLEDINLIGSIPNHVDLIIPDLPTRKDKIQALYNLPNLGTLRCDSDEYGLFTNQEDAPEQDWLVDDSDSESEDMYKFKDEPEDEDRDDGGDGTYVPHYTHYSQKTQLKCRRAWLFMSPYHALV